MAGGPSYDVSKQIVERTRQLIESDQGLQQKEIQAKWDELNLNMQILYDILMSMKVNYNTFKTGYTYSENGGYFNAGESEKVNGEVKKSVGLLNKSVQDHVKTANLATRQSYETYLKKAALSMSQLRKLITGQEEYVTIEILEKGIDYGNLKTNVPIQRVTTTKEALLGASGSSGVILGSMNGKFNLSSLYINYDKLKTVVNEQQKLNNTNNNMNTFVEEKEDGFFSFVRQHWYDAHGQSYGVKFPSARADILEIYGLYVDSFVGKNYMNYSTERFGNEWPKEWEPYLAEFTKSHDASNGGKGGERLGNIENKSSYNQSDTLGAALVKLSVLMEQYEILKNEVFAKKSKKTGNKISPEEQIAIAMAVFTGPEVMEKIGKQLSTTAMAHLNGLVGR